MLLSPTRMDFLKTVEECCTEEFKTLIINGIVKTLVETKDPEDLSLKSLFFKESKKEGFTISMFLKKYNEKILPFQKKYNLQSLFLSPQVSKSLKALTFDLDDEHIIFALSKVAAKGIPLKIYDEESQMTFLFKEDGSCEQYTTEMQR